MSTAARPTAPSPRSPWLSAAVTLLSDRKWHSREEVYASMIDLVPVRDALDRFEPYFITSVNAVNTAQRIVQAKRYVALYSFRNLKRTGKVESGPKGFRGTW